VAVARPSTLSGSPRPPALRLLADAAAVDRRLASLGTSRFAERLVRGDTSLFGARSSARRLIARRLGWLRAPERFLGEASALRRFAQEAWQDGARHVVLLGMGGSSLGPDVLRRILPPRPGAPDFTLLDTTVPAAVARVAGRLDLSRTLFLVSSKSGRTAETLALFSFFWGRMRRLRGALAGQHFVAITDPGTPLSDLAATRRFRAAFHNPQEIGGRFSVLSYFGLVPAALLGIDLEGLLRRAAAMAQACGPGSATRDNPGLVLGAALGALARRGRDKVVLLVDPALEPLALWIEQLLAESTGKEGRGLVPIVETLDGGRRLAALTGADRVGVGLILQGSRGAGILEGILAGRRGAAPNRTPVIGLALRDRLDLGGSMFQWQVATAVAGAILRINPFDEPNVKESKEATEAILAGAGARAGARSRAIRPRSEVGAARDLGPALRALLSPRRRGDYVALLIYADPRDEEVASMAARARARLAVLTGLPVTTAYGPRYLHSTGQLHKGGPASAIVLQVVPDDPTDLPIPGKPYDFERLKQAQAEGDWLALLRRRRRVLRFRHAGEGREALRLLVAALARLPPAARGAPERRRARGGR